jgi:hypothetical protein
MKAPSSADEEAVAGTGGLPLLVKDIVRHPLLVKDRVPVQRRRHAAPPGVRPRHRRAEAGAALHGSRLRRARRGQPLPRGMAAVGALPRARPRCDVLRVALRLGRWPPRHPRAPPVRGSYLLGDLLSLPSAPTFRF